MAALLVVAPFVAWACAHTRRRSPGALQGRGKALIAAEGELDIKGKNGEAHTGGADPSTMALRTVLVAVAIDCE